FQGEVNPPVGYIADFSGGDRRVVEGHREGLAVKVAATDRVVFIEDNRIVGDGVQLDRRQLLHMEPRVARSAMYLRNAAQRIRILYSSAVGVRPQYFRIS